MAQMMLGRLEEAIASFEEVVRRQPDFAMGQYNLGLARQKQGRLDEAIASYQQAVRYQPDYVEAHSNLGSALQLRGRLFEAMASYREALRLQPEFAAAHNNLGTILRDLGHFEEATVCYRRALLLKSDYAGAHVNLALMLLLEGKLEEGWEEYVWRKQPLGEQSVGSTAGLWDGSPLGGRTIVMMPEQGLGDTLQFVRYAPLLKQRGAGKVVAGSPMELVRLLSRCSGVDAVVNVVQLTPLDTYTLLFSLPRLLGTTAVEKIPANVPYIDCDPELAARWEARLATLEGSRSRLRVGIVWQGNPANETDLWRSVRLEQFLPLAPLPGVRLVSLQKGKVVEQLEKMPEVAINLGPELTDMADTAAVIRCLDLVISVDTAVVHLAGALGAPVWVAISRVPDWRWLLEREDSPWYPSMRLFRQTELGQWDDVFARIKTALGDYSVQTKTNHDSAKA